MSTTATGRTLLASTVFVHQDGDINAHQGTYIACQRIVSSSYENMIYAAAERYYDLLDTLVETASKSIELFSITQPYRRHCARLPDFCECINALLLLAFSAICELAFWP